MTASPRGTSTKSIVPLSSNISAALSSTPRPSHNFATEKERDTNEPKCLRNPRIICCQSTLDCLHACIRRQAKLLICLYVEARLDTCKRILAYASFAMRSVCLHSSLLLEEVLRAQKQKLINQYLFSLVNALVFNGMIQIVKLKARFVVVDQSNC